MALSVDEITLKIEKLSKWSDTNKNKIETYRSIVAIIVGLLTMYFTYQIGHKHFYLLLDGIITTGTIVEYKQQPFVDSNRSSTTLFMPIIEFNARDRVVRFRDWLGSRSNGMPGANVTVIYNATEPTVAMVDRPIWNWMPSLVFLMGLLLLLASIKNYYKYSRATDVHPEK